jgi:hypothetical protein
VSESRGLAECECGRIGYALFLCQEHAPIPYTLTVKGIRGARKMRQWDVIFGPLEERRANSAGSVAARKAWATRRGQV